jgi:hypothetical protein
VKETALVEGAGDPNQKGTSQVKRNRIRPGMKVTTGGRGVVGHAGARLLAEVADTLGLTEALSAAMAPTKVRRRGHDRGDVVVDLAVMLANGGETISDLAVLRHQPGLFGAVASTPTAWRTLDAIDIAALARIGEARAEARATAWAAGADPGFYVIDIDGTLIGSHSDKQGAAPTYKRGYGFHPLIAFLDATGEALAGLLRPGNAGSGTATDHVTVLDQALAQLPVDPHTSEITVRTDSAGASHHFIDTCVARGVRFSVGHRLTAEIAAVALAVPERAWVPAVSADGCEERPDAEVCELTSLVDLSGWPATTRMIARREDCHPGAQLTFTDIDGRRYQTFITNDPDPDIAYLEALQRGRGRAERLISDAKDTGMNNLPSATFEINAAWLAIVGIACDLLAWSKLLLLDGDLAAAEPKRLRYCLLHTAAVIVNSGRRQQLRIAAGWPWADRLVAGFDRLSVLRLQI